MLNVTGKTQDHPDGNPDCDVCSTTSLVQLLELILSSSSFITSTEWVVKQQTVSSVRETEVPQPPLTIGMIGKQHIPLSATSHSMPYDWVCAVLYFLLALHGDCDTAAATSNIHIACRIYIYIYIFHDHGDFGLMNQMNCHCL